MQFGQDMDGPNDFSAARGRFVRHPAADLDRTLPKGLVFELLCEDFDVHPDDPDLCAKVNVRLAAEGEERARVLAERKLLKLCRRAEAVLAADLAAANHDSEIADAFMDVKLPARPKIPYFDALPSSVRSDLSSSELRQELRRVRAIPKKDRFHKADEALLRLKEFIERVAGWEREIKDLEDRHEVTAAREEAARAVARTHKLLPELVETPATTSAGVAAKCRVMKAVLKAGYGHHDVFDDLASSIYDAGELLHSDKPRTARPPRSDVGQPANI